MITLTYAVKLIEDEFRDSKIIGIYEYEEYYGFEIAPVDWKPGDLFGSAEIFVRKENGNIVFLSPSKRMTLLKTGRKIAISI